jgi:hypothetical protein
LCEWPIWGAITVVHAQTLDGDILIIPVFQHQVAVAVGK